MSFLKTLPGVHLIGLGALLAVIVAAVNWTTPEKLISVDIELPEIEAVVADVPQNQILTTAYTIVSGDSLSAIFDQADIAAKVMFDVIANSEHEQLLRAILPGETIEFEQDADGKLMALNYIKSLQLTERFELIDGAFVHQHLVRNPEFRTQFSQGTIESSLFLAGQKAGMSDALTMQLAQLFGWDIDFALDIRKSDSFSLIYQKKVLDGKSIGDGAILAAKFTNNGNTYSATRFTDSDGKTDYYDADGKSMRKAFLRTPVEFARISSHFSIGRKHPILNTIRNHKGTDYAAPRGTPVRAAGDGKVVFAGTKGGYGTTLVIQHGQRYSTLYAHLNAFNKSIKVGKLVKQGQIVAYIGSTGLATGPHLHYEFQVNGVQVNPVTVTLPSAQPIKKSDLADYMAHQANMAGQLENFERFGFAPAE